MSNHGKVIEVLATGGLQAAKRLREQTSLSGEERQIVEEAFERVRRRDEAKAKAAKAKKSRKRAAKS